MTRIQVTTLSNLAFSSSTAKNIAMIAEKDGKYSEIITLPTYDMSRVANKPVSPIEDPSTPRLWMGPVDKKICKLPLLSGTLSLLWEAGRRWVSKQQSPRQDVGCPWWKSENTQLGDHHRISWCWTQVWSISFSYSGQLPNTTHDHKATLTSSSPSS